MATLYDTFQAPFGRLPESCEVTVQAPFVRQAGLATLAPVMAVGKVNPTTGGFSVDLPPGPYTVTMRFETTSAAMMRPYSIVIPDDGTHRLSDLLDSQTQWPAPVVGAAQAAAMAAAASAAQAHAELLAAQAAIEAAAEAVAEQIQADVAGQVAVAQAARAGSEAARDAAAVSAGAALASQSAAAASVTASAGSATAAVASRDAALASKDAAASSQSAAAGSQSAASASASAAAGSAADALASQNAAASSASQASTSQSSAATSEGNAAASASAAATSASAASTSASASQNSAVAAAQSAEDAASTVSNGIPNATASQTGGVRLPGVVSGELGGTWDHPAVTGWGDKADLVGGKVPASQLPSLATSETYVVADPTARLALTTTDVQPGDVAVQVGNPGRGTYILKDADPSIAGSWVLMNAPTDAVTSVQGYNGAVVLAKSDLGLGSVDNTSDASKPISLATQTALNTKADSARSVIAGTGLSGGGDLTVSRTLSVAYGNAAGQACQGNDPRLGDTRTPTDNTVSTVKIVDGAVTATKLAANSVYGSKIVANEITATHLNTDAVTTAKIQDSAVTSAKIADGTVVNADISVSAGIDPTKLGAGRVVGSANGTAASRTVWDGTQANYDAVGSKDAATIYFVTA